MNCPGVFLFGNSGKTQKDYPVHFFARFCV